MKHYFYYSLFMLATNCYGLDTADSKVLVNQAIQTESSGLLRPLKDALIPLLDQETETGYSEEEQKSFKALEFELLNAVIHQKTKEYADSNQSLEKKKHCKWLKPAVISFITLALGFYGYAKWGIKAPEKPVEKIEGGVQNTSEISYYNNILCPQYKFRIASNNKVGTFFLGLGFVGACAEGWRLFKINKLTGTCALLKKQTEYLLELKKKQELKEKSSSNGAKNV